MPSLLAALASYNVYWGRGWPMPYGRGNSSVTFLGGIVQYDIVLEKPTIFLCAKPQQHFRTQKSQWPNKNIGIIAIGPSYDTSFSLIMAHRSHVSFLPQPLLHLPLVLVCCSCWRPLVFCHFQLFTVAIVSCLLQPSLPLWHCCHLWLPLTSDVCSNALSLACHSSSHCWLLCWRVATSGCCQSNACCLWQPNVASSTAAVVVPLSNKKCFTKNKILRRTR